ERVSSVLYGASLVKTREKVDGYLVFKSNQGTGAHLKNEVEVSDLKPFTSGTLTGVISEKPTVTRGGHTTFSIAKSGRNINCAIYSPTGLTTTASKLILGDLVRVGGGIRKASKNHQRILNVEFLEILKLKKNLKYLNPACHKCNKRMKSKGKNQGFECASCRSKSNQKIIQSIPRDLERRLYLPTSSAHRHLTRPMQRIGKINEETFFDDSLKWFKVF
ncbi:MAG: DNA-binding protein, partial [Nitrosopumilaceae archaeon]